ncbi:MAG: sensor histidine kinase [Mogibacterium sp.]|nr:sensor histidine kinase [Mogibacterium sp.]
MNSAVVSGSLIDVLSYAIEMAVVVWFFQRMRPRDASGSKVRTIAGHAALLLILAIYLTPLNAGISAFSAENFLIQIFRMALHLVPVFLYLLLTKETTAPIAAYLAAFMTAIYLTAQNLRAIIMTYVIITPPHTARGEGYIAGLIVTAAVEIALAAIARSLILPQYIDQIDRNRITLMSIVLFMMVYFKWMLTAIRELNMGGDRTTMVSFSLVTSFGLYLVLLLYDYSRRLLYEKDSAEHEKLTLQYEVRNAQREMQASTDIRRLHHDVKNHLLAIKSMAGDSAEIDQYLNELLPQFEGYEMQVHTGNQIVDAILSEKVRQGSQDGIRFNIVLDLTALQFMKGVDLITIFGNAADNAIEALRKLPEGEERYVYMKSSSFANNLLIKIENRYAGTVVMKNGVPVTSKKDSELHGIGVGSIRNAAARYGGTVGVKSDDDTHLFTLTIMIPLPSDS